MTLMKFSLIGIALGLLLLLPPGEAAAQQKISRSELGDTACRGLDAYCTDIWARGVERGAPFHLLIFHVCVTVWNRDGDHNGIDCVERAIAVVPKMAKEDLIFGQFGAGEREKNNVWANRSDEAWANLIRQAIVKIPPYCDQHTPVIFNYFPCIANEVLALPDRLKKFI